MLAPAGLRFVWLRGPRQTVAQCAGFRPRSWADAVRRRPGGGIRSAAPPGRASESRSPDAGGARTLSHQKEVRGGRASSLPMSVFFSPPRLPCAIPMLAPVGLRFVWLRGPRLVVAPCVGLGPRSWADAMSRWPGGGIRSTAPLGRASESRSSDAGDSRTLPHKMQVRGGKAWSLRMSGCCSRRGCPAPFRCSPRWGCASYGSGVLGWRSRNTLVLDRAHGQMP